MGITASASALSRFKLIAGLGFVAMLWSGGVATGQQPDTHGRHVIFENSAADNAHYYSRGRVVAPSELELVRGKCPVDSHHFVSPGNSLRLKWKSVRGADWHMSVRVPERLGPRAEIEGDTVSFWCYATAELSGWAAPRFRIRDSQGGGLPDVPLIGVNQTLPAGQWVRLDFPLPNFAGAFRGTGDTFFDPKKIDHIVFSQGLDDGEPHTLFIDDIRVVDISLKDEQPPATPTELAAEGSDSHCDLKWKSNEDPDLLSYRIYRSEDGKTFTPLTTRPGNSPRGVDFLGPDKSAWYKISAVDLQNNESPLSEAVQASTRTLNDDELLEMVQRSCFRYYWDAAHPIAGMALETLPGDENLIALGGSGFGISALVVAAEREFVTREEAAERLLKILRFLKTADRFHGAWPHFLNGSTGKAWPLFGKYDNGADLVETAFMMQGLLTARQYFSLDNPQEQEIRDTITTLWREVEWDWFRQTPDGEVLYWHWSPDYGWHISHPLVGWNETMIAYLLAIASPTHPVPASLYYTGWAGQSELAANYRHAWSRTTEGDRYVNGRTYYGYKLDVGSGTGGDLFFAQFSFLGFDPRGIRDRFTNYFYNNRQLALINRAYCMENPRNRKGYGPNCWGVSAGANSGGGKPQPRDDSGTICISAALGVMPYTPEESMAALKHFYRTLGDRTWGVYGFHDGFNQTLDWYDEMYMALNQAQIVVGIENYRTGLCWKYFMSNPEIKPMLDAIGFQPDQDDLAQSTEGS